ncbi:predicted protein [Plenodomus lingam JN3]|uniref:Predicted protein n=1 Tax=Leptosphaeria maculans (strain JN3 / isolate v23.1.3 / race Av1-4-5-6-7-8) TaxID=985895 RepID=E5A2B3_LEPMJ|nr:predicted protein [Plenodomus lingam JN3]CBX97548.1 predicted protein [Plenodomus lingam JN3]
MKRKQLFETFSVIYQHKTVFLAAKLSAEGQRWLKNVTRGSVSVRAETMANCTTPLLCNW